MKILLVTESWDMSTGPYESLYPYYRQILLNLGHEVEVVDNKKNYLPIGGQTMWDYSPFFHRLRWPRWNNYIVNHRLRQIALNYQPDLILLTKCENISSETIAWLKQHTHAVIFNWNHDNPFWADNTSLDLLRSISLYDGFGIWAKFLFPVLYSLGCRRVEYLPMFFNTERFKLDEEISGDDWAQFKCDIAFVGNGSPERAEMLRHLVGFDLAIWGNWKLLEKDDPLLSKIRGFQLGGQNYAKVMRCCKIAINVLNTHNRFGSNTRTFEAAGLGALLLTEYTQEQAEDLFKEDEEIICYRSPEDLQQKVCYYLAHPEKAEQIARAGQVRTLREHTLEHRLKRIVDITEMIHKV